MVEDGVRLRAWPGNTERVGKRLGDHPSFKHSLYSKADADHQGCEDLARTPPLTTQPTLALDGRFVRRQSLMPSCTRTTVNKSFARVTQFSIASDVGL